MTEVPSVTVLIPARNEAADIERCLRAVMSQDYPHDRMEIVVVDGQSTDSTATVASQALGSGDITWRIVENSTGTTPSSLNAGRAVASGDVLCRVDARSIIPPDYIRLCAEILAECLDIVVTGGSQVAVAVDGSPRARGIARALNNRYAMGGARYRSGASSGPSDTVYLGAFRTSELDAAGGWDERMLTNQDFDLNRRMGRRGTIWFDDRVTVDYLPRRSLGELWRQYIRFGRWKVRYWRLTGDRPQPRQLVLLVGPAAVIAMLTIAALATRSQRVVAIELFAAATAALVIEHAGAGSKDPVSLVARLYAVAALAGVSSGWLAGVILEAMIGRKGAGDSSQRVEPR